jgi:putative transposase
LLIETPKANLSRIMQHINGVYTQRHNRKKKRDGTLFSGRFKSVLVDEDSYLLQLTRYIHRNPLEVKRKMVERLEDYVWSSYPAYINQSIAPTWLYQDEDLKRFYGKHNIPGVLGDKEFRAARKEENEETEIIALRAALQDHPSMDEMMK